MQECLPSRGLASTAAVAAAAGQAAWQVVPGVHHTLVDLAGPALMPHNTRGLTEAEAEAACSTVSGLTLTPTATPHHTPITNHHNCTPKMAQLHTII